MAPAEPELVDEAQAAGSAPDVPVSPDLDPAFWGSEREAGPGVNMVSLP